jgi:hypothetical protein
VCNACWLRKQAAFVLAVLPFALSLLKLLDVGNGPGHGDAAFDFWLKTTCLTGVLAYYTARRFSERAGLGLRITEMSPSGSLVTLRCKSMHDALEIAERTRAAEERARPAVRPPMRLPPEQAPAHSAQSGVLARYRRSRAATAGALLVLLGLAVAVEMLRAALPVDLRPLSILCGGGALVLLPLLFSRKALLTVTRDGFVYARWGPRLVRWSELEWAALHDPTLPDGPPVRVIEVQPRDPEAFVASLSTFGRLQLEAAALSGRPDFAIDAHILDADADEVFAHFRRNLCVR